MNIFRPTQNNLSIFRLDLLQLNYYKTRFKKYKNEIEMKIYVQVKMIKMLFKSKSSAFLSHG